MNMARALLCSLVVAAGALQLKEVAPLKGAMLARSWLGDAAEGDQKIGKREDGGIGALRYGDDLRRRENCQRGLKTYVDTALALAAADKSRGAGAPRKTATFAVLDGAGPNTLSMVKREDDGWTLLGLYCNPSERDLDVVADAEAETIGAIRDAAGVPLGFLGGVEETLVGSYGT